MVRRGRAGRPGPEAGRGRASRVRQSPSRPRADPAPGPSGPSGPERREARRAGRVRSGPGQAQAVPPWRPWPHRTASPGLARPAAVPWDVSGPCYALLCLAPLQRQMSCSTAGTMGGGPVRATDRTIAEPRAPLRWATLRGTAEKLNSLILLYMTESTCYF